MGLDMYLHRKHYIWSKDREKLQITGIIKGTGINSSKVKYIIEEVMYWRKANAIHKWFVDCVQKGNDDCGTYDVSKEQLQALLDLVTSVLKDRTLAAQVLPTQEGFFFGSTEYDEYYWQDLEDTKAALTEILATEGDVDYEYHSSW